MRDFFKTFWLVFIGFGLNAYSEPIPTQNVPELTRELEKIIERLAAAQIRINNSDPHNQKITKVLSSVQIEDNPIHNASVVYDHIQDGTIRYKVSINSGLLKRYSRPEDSEKIVAVLAHELAHPLDETSGFRIGDSLFDRQALEIKTDALGNRILSEAGYRPELTLETLSDFATLSNGKPDAIGAAINTHPQHLVRETANRIAVTIDRYEYGRNKTFNNSSIFSQKALSELQLVEEAKEQIHPHPRSIDELKSLDELIQELDRSTFSNESLRIKNVLAREALISSFEKRLDKTPHLTQDQIQRIANFYLKYSQSGYQVLSSDFVQHKEMINKLPFFQSPEYQKAYLGLLKKSDEFYLTTLQAALPKKVIDQSSPELWKPMIQSSKGGKLYQWNPHLSQFSNETRLALSEALIAHRLKNITLKESVEFLANQPKSRSFYIPIFVRKGGNQLTHSSNFQALAKPIWEQRGRLAISGLFDETRAIDWSSIFKALNIPEKEGFAELKSSTIKLLDSKEFSKEFEDALLFYKDLNAKPLTGQFQQRWINEEVLSRFNALPKKFTFAKDALENFQNVFIPNLYISSNQLTRSLYLKEVERSLHSGVTQNLHTSALNKLYLSPDLKLGASLDATKRNKILDLSDLVARAVERSSLSESDKSAILAREYATIAWSESKDASQIAKKLIKHGVYKDVADVILSSGYQPNLFPLVSEEMASIRSQKNNPLVIQRFEKLNRACFQKLSNNKYRAFQMDEKDFPKMVAIHDEMVEVLKELPIDGDSKYEQFRMMTSNFSNSKSDRLFVDVIAPKISPQKILDILSDQKITQSSEQAKLIDRYFFPKSAHRSLSEKSLEKIAESLALKHSPDVILPPSLMLSKNVESPLVELTRSIEKLTPSPSTARDQLLEKLAYLGGLKDQKDLRLIEELKTYHLPKNRLSYVNRASYFADLLDNAPPELIEETLFYLKNSDYNPKLPENLKSLLKAYSKQKDIRPQMDLAFKVQKPSGGLEGVFQNIEEAAAGLNAREKVPLYDLLFHLGSQPMVDDPQFESKVIRDLIQIEPGSTTEKSLLAYLKTIPAHENTVTLAHQLSLSANEAGSIRDAFLPFKSVGKKAAQAVSTFDVLGEAVSAELAVFKDNADAMPMSKIWHILESSLSKKEFEKIRYLNQVLGAASMKTVVEAELNDGRKVAIAVLDPLADNQVSHQLSMGKNYLKNLEQFGLTTNESLAPILFDSLTAQMDNELDLRLEAKKHQRAVEIFQKLNRTQAKKLNGWEIRPPQLISDFKPTKNVLVMEKIEGVPFSRVPEHLKPVLGEATARMHVESLLQYGFINADPHGGNHLYEIDPAKKWIQPLDFGQGVKLNVSHLPWSGDDRTLLSEFLIALDRKDSKALSQQLVKMSENKSVSSETLNRLAGSFDRVFKESHQTSKQVLNLMKACADHGIVVQDKYMSGVFKGLMALYSEGYVQNPAQMNAIIKEAVEGSLAKKPLHAYKAIRETTGSDCSVSSILRQMIFKR